MKTKVFKPYRVYIDSDSELSECGAHAVKKV